MIKRPLTILVLLTGLNLLNYLDRMVVAAVLPKITDELKFSNTIGGVLATIFLVGYMLTSPFFGSMADRGSRKGLIAFGVAVWSIATFASGLAIGTKTLILARACVGIGEASYATIAPTIIDDIAPADKKARWLSVFYVASPIGAALGFVVGDLLASRWGWRVAFWAAGGPGLLLAVLCLFIEEPVRKTVKEKVNLIQSAITLVRVPIYRRGVLGYCAYTAAIGAFSHWAPTFLERRYALKGATVAFGVVTVIAGAIGTGIGGSWADGAQKKAAAEPDAPPKPPEGEAPYRDETPEKIAERAAEAESRRDRRSANALLRVCAIGSLVGAPLAFVCFPSPSVFGFFGVVAFCEVFLFLSTSPINAIILKSVPTHLRASAMALSIFSTHLLGDLWSPTFVGFLMDKLPPALAMMALPVFIGVSAAVWWPRAREAR
jgi:MFS family permease